MLGIFFSGTASLSSSIVVGIIFSLLPDIDFLWHVLHKRSIEGIDHTHRELLHYPILYIVVGTVVTWTVQPSFAPLFAVASLLHFAHDSIGIGWGIPWLYPFSQKYYKAFSEKDGTFSWNLLTSWTPQEQKEVERTAGDPHWLRNIYFRPTPISIIEVLGFVVALIFLLALR